MEFVLFVYLDLLNIIRVTVQVKVLLDAPLGKLIKQDLPTIVSVNLLKSIVGIVDLDAPLFQLVN